MNIVQRQEKLAAITTDYINALEEVVNNLEKEIKEVIEAEKSDNPDWEKSIENYLDELHSVIYALPEPREGHKELHKKIVDLRKRIKDIYAEFKALTKNN